MLGIIGIGGRCADTCALRAALPKEYFAVAADSGLRHLRMLGLRPDLLAGDLDSIGQPLLEQARREGVPILQFDAKKNETDSEIAVGKALEHGCDSLLFLGAFGGRLDHMLSNQMLAASLAARGIPSVLTDGVTFMYTVTPRNSPFRYPARGLDKKKDVLSLVPVDCDSILITLDGFEYPLCRDTILFGSTRMVSNTVAWDETARKDFLTVAVEKGIAFFIATKNDEYLDDAFSQNL